MKRNRGQAIPEYVLIGALIAIVAIPALMMLSGNIGKNLNKAGSGGSFNPLGGLIDNSGGVNPAFQGAMSKMISAQTANEAGNYQVKYDPSTGTFSFTSPLASSGGSNTASSHGDGGTTAFAGKMLNQLATDWISADGKNLGALCPPCRVYLINAGNNAVNGIAPQENMAANTWGAGGHPSLWALKDASQSFQQNIDGFDAAINQAIAADPAHASDLAQVKQMVSGYSGVTSSIYLQNYLTQANTAAWNGTPPDYAALAVGTPPAGLQVSLGASAAVTTVQGGNIAGSAKKL